MPADLLMGLVQLVLRDSSKSRPARLIILFLVTSFGYFHVWILSIFGDADRSRLTFSLEAET